MERNTNETNQTKGEELKANTYMRERNLKEMRRRLSTLTNLVVFSKCASGWLRATHFVDMPKVYCCYLSWLIVTSQNPLNLLY